MIEVWVSLPFTEYDERFEWPQYQEFMRILLSKWEAVDVIMELNELTQDILPEDMGKWMKANYSNKQIYEIDWNERYELFRIYMIDNDELDAFVKWLREITFQVPDITAVDFEVSFCVLGVRYG